MGEEGSTFPRNQGSDPSHGIDFEWKRTLLAYLECVEQHEEWERTKKSGVKSFFVANNVQGVGAFDDVVVRKEIVQGVETQKKLLFIQCKHVEVGKPSAQKVERYLGKKEIQKYFDSYLKVRSVLHNETYNPQYLVGKTVKEREEAIKTLKLRSILNCDFKDCEFQFVTNIDLVPSELFENITNNTEDSEVQHHLTSFFCETGNEYALSSRNCLDFLVCDKEIAHERSDLLEKFRRQFRIFSIKGDKTHCQIDTSIKNLIDENLKQNFIFKCKLRDTLLEEIKMNFESKSNQLLTEKSDLIRKMILLSFLRESSETKIDKYYHQRIPLILSIEAATKLISNLKANNETKYKKLYNLRINYAFFCLKTEYITIFINNIDDFNNWKLARCTFKYRKENKVYIYFNDFLSVPSEKEENEIFIQIQNRCEKKSEPTIYQQLFADELTIVETSKLIFQGHKIQMQDIGNFWKENIDEDTICEILESNLIEIGRRLPNEANFYLDRKLKIKEMNGGMIRLIKGSIPAGRKNIFVLFTQIEKLTDWTKGSYTYFENLEIARKDLLELLKKSGYSFYFFSYFNDMLELRCTFGKACVHLVDKIVDESYVINKHCSDRITIISDVAGMGKSTSMLKLALDFKANNNSHWVYFIELGKFNKIYENAKGLCTVATAVNFLSTELLGLKKIEIALFSNACFETGNVAIFFDGFDELSPKARSSFIQHILALENTKIFKIFIASRRTCVGEIEKYTLQKSIDFVEFDFKEKVNCLIGIWKQKYIKTEEQINEEHLKNIASSIVNNLESKENSIREILAIPLQIKMFAEAYYDEILEYCKNDVSRIVLNFHLDLLNLYKRFILTQVIHFYSNKWDVKWNNISEHTQERHVRDKLKNTSEFVCSIIIPNLLRNDAKDFSDTIIALRDDLGLIVDDTQSPPLFLHKTIAEYLTAEYIVQVYLSHDNDEESEKVFESILMDDGYDVLRKFINSFLEEDFFPKYFEDIGKELEEQSELATEKSPFHVAAFEGNVKLMKALYRREKYLINLKNNKNESPLHYACLTGKLEAVEFLLNQNCSVTDRDKEGDTAFHNAVKKGYNEIMELLCQREKSLINMKNINGWTPLYHACYEENNISVNFLLSHGCSLKERDINGETPFRLAARNNKIKKMELFLTYDNSLINITNKNNNTPIQGAIYHGQMDSVKFLLSRGCSVNNRDKDGDTAFNEAALENNVEAMELLLQKDKLLINEANDKRETPLHQACHKGNAEVVTFLLANNE